MSTSPTEPSDDAVVRSRRRHMQQMHAALGRYARRMEEYHKSVAGGDPGDIEAWLHSLARLRAAHDAATDAVMCARILDRSDVATLLPGGRIDDVAHEIMHERLYLAQCGRPFAGDDRARAEIALERVTPPIPLDLPVMPERGQSVIAFIFPPSA